MKPSRTQKLEEKAIAEAKVEEAYQVLEALLSQRVAEHTEPALEAKIEAQFEALTQRKQERADAIERPLQTQGPAPLDELKEALAEARRLVKESEEAHASKP